MAVREELSRLFSPALIGGLRLRNRFIRSAAFEGMCPDGDPTVELVDCHPDVGGKPVGHGVVTRDQQALKTTLVSDIRVFHRIAHGVLAQGRMRVRFV